VWLGTLQIKTPIAMAAVQMCTATRSDPKIKTDALM
jgi:hypothetical protein